MNVLGIDPGNTAGWCLITEKGDPAILQSAGSSWGHVSHEDWADFLTDIIPSDVDTIVIEDYRIFQKYAKAHTGVRLVTIEMIGATDLWARMHKIPVIKQRSNILPTAQKLTGRKLPGTHSESHWVSAYNHAAYWLISQNLMTPPSAGKV